MWTQYLYETFFFMCVSIIFYPFLCVHHAAQYKISDFEKKVRQVEKRYLHSYRWSDESLVFIYLFLDGEEREEKEERLSNVLLMHHDKLYHYYHYRHLFLSFPFKS